MNHYGQRAMRHWQTHRPEAFAQLPNPQEYFTTMGERIATTVADLIPTLAGADHPGEEYLEKVARLNEARLRAEEIAMEDEGAQASPELSREEWEDTTSETTDSLLDWAWKMKDQLDGDADHGLTWEDSERRWLLPLTFLQEMAAAQSPLEYLREHSSIWETSVENRWARDSNRPAR